MLVAVAGFHVKELLVQPGWLAAIHDALLVAPVVTTTLENWSLNPHLRTELVPQFIGQYTVIGNVLSGMDIVDKLKMAPAGSQSGAVTDPDKMVKVQVAADMK